MKYVYIEMILAIITLIVSVDRVNCQNEIRINENDRFCTIEWLIDYKDTIRIELDETKIKRGTKYCVIEKKKYNKYDIWCWFNEGELESLTTFDKKLKLKFKKEGLLIKFGEEQNLYKLYKNETNEIYLTKELIVK